MHITLSFRSKLFVSFSLVLLLARASSGAVGAANKTILLPNCGNSTDGGAVEPSSWDNGCDNLSELVSASWVGWGKAKATAKGQSEVNDCDPYCAIGTIRKSPTIFTASVIRSCRTSSGDFLSFYTKVKYTYRVNGKSYSRALALECQR
jgi:hypothetical protein